MAIDPKYKPIFTLVGLNKIAAAINSGTKIELRKMALGDANASDYTPSESMDSLVNEVIRFNLRTLWYENITAINKTVLKFTGILEPGLISSKTVREVGVFDSQDDLIIVFRIPDRPILTEGNIATVLDLTFGISLANDSNIFMTLGSNTGDFTTLTEYNGHVNNLMNPHGVTKAQVGLGLAENTADNAKNVLSATKLTTARTINNVSFDGTANITIYDGTKVMAATRTDWITKNVLANVVGGLGWRNFGDGHSIIDASKSLSPEGTAINNKDATNPWAATSPTLVGWNGTATYGLRVDSSRTADKLLNARTITVNSGATGSVNFDGSGNVTLSLTITNNSHLHTIANITGLQTALDNKVATSTVNVNKTTNTIPIRDASGILYSTGINANQVVIDNGSNYGGDGGELVFKSNGYQDTFIDNINGILRMYKNGIGNMIDFGNDAVNLRRDTYIAGLLHKDGSIMTSNSREYMYANPHANTNDDLGVSLNYSTKGNFQVYDGLGKNIIHGKTNDIVLNVNKTTLNGNLYLKRPTNASGAEGARIFMASPPDSGAGNDGYIDYVFTGGQHQFRLITGNGQMFTMGRGGGEIFHSGFMGQGSGLVADSLRGYLPTQFVRNDQFAPQYLQHELSVGAGITSGNEGGQVNFKRPPSSGGDWAYIDTYGTSYADDYFRMVMRGATLRFPVANATVLSTADLGHNKGVDADTIDGYHATQLMKVADAGGVNANNIVTAGSYRIGDYQNGGNTGCPEVCNYGQLLVIRGGGDTVTQIVTDFGSNHIFFRSGAPAVVGGGGAWGAWKRLIHDNGTYIEAPYGAPTGWTKESNGVCRQWGWYNSSNLVDNNIAFHFAFAKNPMVKITMLGVNPAYASIVGIPSTSHFSVTKSAGFGFFWEAVGQV